MKKILATLVALSSLTAAAGMISFDFNDYVNDSDAVFSPKFSRSVEGDWNGATAGDKDKTTMQFGLNYAHQLSNGGQVQGLFSKKSVDDGTNDGSEMTIGLGYIHNMGSDLSNTVYFAFRYLMKSTDNDKNVAGIGAKDAEWTTMQVEAGKRMKAFSTGRYNWSYSPSITVSQVSENKEAGDETDMNITLNLLKFDVLF
jgi:hypothetical protein